MTATSTVRAGDGEHPVAADTAVLTVPDRAGRVTSAARGAGVAPTAEPHEPDAGHHDGHQAGSSPDDPDALGLAFAFEHGPPGNESGERGQMFRFPAADDTGPGGKRLLGMSLYTALIGLLALAVTLRGLLVIAGGSAPGWYPTAFAAAGLIGVASVVGGFLSIHRRRLPWMLLALGAVPLAINIAVTLGVA